MMPARSKTEIESGSTKTVRAPDAKIAAKANARQLNHIQSHAPFVCMYRTEKGIDDTRPAEKIIYLASHEQSHAQSSPAKGTTDSAQAIHPPQKQKDTAQRLKRFVIGDKSGTLPKCRAIKGMVKLITAREQDTDARTYLRSFEPFSLAKGFDSDL